MMASFRSGEQGFTLLEMLAAMAILILGVTSLLGALSAGLGIRRGAEQRSRAALLADQVIMELRTQILSGPAEDRGLGSGLAAAEIEAITVTRIDGYRGMKYSVEFLTDVEYPDLALARLRISWLHQGSDVGIEFLRLLSNSSPLSYRVETRMEQRRRSP